MLPGIPTPRKSRSLTAYRSRLSAGRWATAGLPDADLRLCNGQEGGRGYEARTVGKKVALYEDEALKSEIRFPGAVIENIVRTENSL